MSKMGSGAIFKELGMLGVNKLLLTVIVLSVK